MSTGTSLGGAQHDQLWVWTDDLDPDDLSIRMELMWALRPIGTCLSSRYESDSVRLRSDTHLDLVRRVSVFAFHEIPGIEQNVRRYECFVSGIFLVPISFPFPGSKGQSRQRDKYMLLSVRTEISIDIMTLSSFQAAFPSHSIASEFHSRWRSTNFHWNPPSALPLLAVNPKMHSVGTLL